MYITAVCMQNICKMYDRPSSFQRLKILCQQSPGSIGFSVLVTNFETSEKNQALFNPQFFDIYIIKYIYF